MHSVSGIKETFYFTAFHRAYCNWSAKLLKVSDIQRDITLTINYVFDYYTNLIVDTEKTIDRPSIEA